MPLLPSCSIDARESVMAIGFYDHMHVVHITQFQTGCRHSKTESLPQGLPGESISEQVLPPAQLF